MTVEGNVGFGIKQGDRRGQVAWLLGVVGLSGMGKRMPHELSGGQQQRVALARSLAASPQLILLDEPFSNLDPAVRAQVRAELREILRRLQMTAVFVTHDQEEALALGDRVGVMIDGRIMQAGPPEDIYRRPATRSVAHFLGDANFLPGRVTGSEVECELGVIDVFGPGQPGEVEVMLRPEQLVLASDDGVPVTVVAREYFGHDQLITVKLPSGREIRVRTINAQVFDSGDSLALRVTGHAIVFRSR